MKIAIPYSEGEVFQHFGRTEQFKIYEIKEGTVAGSEIIDTNGTGHEALADFLADNEVSAVLCGGLGEGAQNALSDAGIIIYTGVSGDPDEAIAAFMRGELTSGGANCDHHEESSGGCGGGCGSGCGGCGGGCPHHAPTVEGPNAGKNVSVHYTGTFDDGTKFDSSYDRDEPLDFVCGAGMMIPGFDKAVAIMEVGQSVDIHLAPEEAYGASNPNLILTAPLENVPNADEFDVGDQVYLQNNMGQPVPARITAKDDKSITFDANHEMAGKSLNFHIELLEVKD